MEAERKLLSAVIMRAIDDACMASTDRKHSPVPEAHHAIHWLLHGDAEPWFELLDLDYTQFKERLLQRMWSEARDNIREQYRRKFFRRNYELYYIAKHRGIPVPIDLEENEDDLERPLRSGGNRWNPGWSVGPDI